MRVAFRRGWIASLAAAAMAVAGGSAGAKDLTEIVLGVSNFSMNSSMFTAAMELGYFEEEGLKLRIQEFQGGAIVMPQVATKSVQIGGGAADPLIVGNQPGKTPLPIKFFYNQARDYYWEFLVPAGSPIKSVADLKGKKIGVGALTNSHMPVTRLILKDNGLEQTKDYSFLAIGTGGAAFKALMDGQVDAYFTFTSNTGAFESLPGVQKFGRLAIPDRYKTLFQNSYFAHEDTFKQNPQILIGFGRAAAKATVFCRIAMEYCIKSFWKYNPNVRPREGSEDENAKRLVPTMQATWDGFLAFPPGQPRRFGEFPAASWNNFVSVLAEGGEIPAKYDPSSLYTNELIAKFNDFDVAAIEKQAQSYVGK